MIKITIRKDNPDANLKWWVEGYENKQLSDNDIQEVLNMIDIAKKDIEERMKLRMEIEGIVE